MNAISLPLALAALAQFTPPKPIEATPQADSAPSEVEISAPDGQVDPFDGESAGASIGDVDSYAPALPAGPTPPTPIDGGVSPAAYEAAEPLVPVHSADHIALARNLIEQATQDQLDTEDNLTLVALLRQHHGRSDRVKSVQSYWRLSAQIASRSFAGADVRFLRDLPAPTTALEQALWNAELASAQARLARDELAVLQQQQQLQRTGDTGKPLPFPADAPFIGKYRTELKSLFAGRPAPTRIKHVAQALPHQLQLIETTAAAVNAREAALQEAAATYQQGQVLISTVLDLLKQLRAERAAFLTAVRDYNGRIAEYSLAVVSPNTPPERLAATLIQSPLDGASPQYVAGARFRQVSSSERQRSESARRGGAFREVEGQTTRRKMVAPRLP